MYAITFSHVYKTLSCKRIISNASFAIRQRETVGIIGPVGSGKTTLLALASSLLLPDRGTIRIEHMSLLGRPTGLLQKMNFASSAIRLSGYSSVMENLMTFAHLYAVSDPKKKIYELADLFGVRQLLDSGVKVFRLSQGENTKINLVKSLLNDPKILLLDEITSHLDGPSKTSVFSYLQMLQRKHKTTILFASQQIEDIAALCARVLVINRGRIRHFGSLPTAKKLQSYYA